MTLLATEIHRSARGDVIVFVADRRITTAKGAAPPKQQIFRIPGRAARLGYFGLASIPAEQGQQHMADWVQDSTGSPRRIRSNRSRGHSKAL